MPPAEARQASFRAEIRCRGTLLLYAPLSALSRRKKKFLDLTGHKDYNIGTLLNKNGTAPEFPGTFTVLPARIPGIAEVNAINRQQFLTELSKLLTFMYEEDRQRALSMYERMFDITEDEQGLIQHMMSPTRQAVLIARAYDDKERKLSVSSQSRGDSGEAASGTVPKFVLVINKVFDDLFPDRDEGDLSQDQVSFFDLGLAAKEDFTPAKPSVPAGAVLLSDTQQFRLETPEEAAPADTSAEASPAAVPAEKETAPSSVEADFDPESVSMDELISSLKRDLEADSAAQNAAPSAGGAEAAEEAAEPAAETASDETEEAAAADQSPSPGEAPSDADDGTLPAEEDVSVPSTEELPEDTDSVLPPDAPEENALPDSGEAVPAPAAPRREETTEVLSVPKLVLFLIPAIPITIALLALLAVPALLFLGLSLGLIALGASLVVSAFSGIAVLADTLLLIGAALAALALGLLFLWLFVWVIGSGMAGLIRLVRRLGREFCMKEVPAA